MRIRASWAIIKVAAVLGDDNNSVVQDVLPKLQELVEDFLNIIILDVDSLIKLSCNSISMLHFNKSLSISVRLFNDYL